MSDRFNLDQIREFWSEQAREHRQSPTASWSDVPVIDMEIAAILRHLADRDRVLDVGCANGYSTVQFASQRRISVRGVDYIPEMIEHARARLVGLIDKLPGTVEFDVGDITALAEPSGAYDKVVVIRVVINLGDEDRQVLAIRECGRVLRSGGLLLCSEATLDGWRRLNRFRQEWGLPEIPMPPFNLYLDHGRLVEAVATELELVDIVDFSSTYYVGTRVLKPLLVQALGADIDVANPDMEWNRWFSLLPPWGGYGVQKLLVFRRLP